MISIRRTTKDERALLAELAADVREAFGVGLDAALDDAAAAYRVEAGRSLTRRSGSLVASFRAERGGDALRVVSDAPQAGILSTGGTIRAVRARYLAIPVPGTGDRKPRSYGNALRFIRGRRGPMLAEIVAGRVCPRFAMRESIRIQGTHYLERGADAADRAAKESVEDELGRVR